MTSRLLDPDPAGLRAALGDDAADRNGVPRADAIHRRAAAGDAVTAVLDHLLQPGGVATSVLGDGWSTDLDVYLTAPPSPAALEAAGWVPLDPVLEAIGSPAEGRWAVVAGGRVLGAADLQVGLPPDPVTRVLARCRRRGEVRLREVLELRELARSGAPFPPGGDVLTVAADAETALGGSELARWASGARPGLPARVRWGRARQRHEHTRRWLRPRLVVAFSGVDGSGKSSLACRLADDLRTAGVITSVVWARPGMGIGWLAGSAAAAKRLLGQPADPGVRAVAAGRAAEVASRRGVVGWAWSTAVTAAFVAGVRRRHAGAVGVLVYDRHLLDALVTLDFVYRGVDLRLQRALVRRLLPTAAVTFYLDVPPEVAVARKPGDTFGDFAVRRQLEHYSARRGEVPVVALDATRPAAELAADVLARLPAILAARGGDGVGGGVDGRGAGWRRPGSRAGAAGDGAGTVRRRGARRRPARRRR